MAINFSNIFLKTKTIAIVGISNKPDRPSYQVAQYLLNHGFKIIPVNPAIKEVLGQTCYPTLKDIPCKVDMVDVFRKPEDCLSIAQDAVFIGASCLWLQMGVVNEQAAQHAKDQGLEVVMDYCTKIEYQRLL